MVSRYLIVYFFSIENLLGHVTSNGTKTDFEFEVELLEGLAEALHPESVLQTVGPQFPEDNRIRNELCIAAKNYVSFEMKNSTENLSSRTSMWCLRHYLDPQNGTSETENKHFIDPSRPIFLNYIFCNTIPKDIYLRATDSPNKFVIALKGISKMDGIYHGMMSDIKEYSFKLKMVETDLVESTNAAGKSEKDTLAMENDDLRGVYKATKFMDWIHICLKARDYIRRGQDSLSSKLVVQRSPAGLRSLKMCDSKTGKLEDHVTFRCPIMPLLHVYFANSKTVTVVLDLETCLTLGLKKTRRPFLSIFKKHICGHDTT